MNSKLTIKVETWPRGKNSRLPFDVYVADIFYFRQYFVFRLFFGMVMYANVVETKEKEKLPDVKN